MELAVTLRWHQGRAGYLCKRLLRFQRWPLNQMNHFLRCDRQMRLGRRGPLTRFVAVFTCILCHGQGMQTIPTVSAGGVHELKPINCIANTRAPNPDTVSTGGGAHTGLQIGGSGMTLGQVGGKRVVAPKVTGAGVASKQPSRLPPRAAVVCLDDIDVATHRDAQEQPQRSPTERERELPSLPAPDR